MRCIKKKIKGKRLGRMEFVDACPPCADTHSGNMDKALQCTSKHAVVFFHALIIIIIIDAFSYWITVHCCLCVFPTVESHSRVANDIHRASLNRGLLCNEETIERRRDHGNNSCLQEGDASDDAKRWNERERKE